jgi:hypothetical protein
MGEKGLQKVTTEISLGEKDFCGVVESAFETLKGSCPTHVDIVDWQRAVVDGQRSLEAWGPQARALGWSDSDLFGLAEVPARPVENYRRLSRLDVTGLVWLLHGRPVTEFTADTAVIKTSTGAVTFYKQRSSPCPA